MSTYTVTVIRTGNSYALRVPKRYVEDGELELGQKVELSLPTSASQQDPDMIQHLLSELNEAGAYSDMEDPVAWQREQRQDRTLPGRS